MHNWLDRLLAQHIELESPTNFWFWSALASISAVVKDNVWVDRQIYNLYPNIYVMLHADSGLKKGPPISMAKQLVKAVGGTRVITGRSSIQGILKDLGTAETVPGGKPLLKSVAFICSSELSSSLVEDKVATDILTDLYDRQYNIGEWRSLLKMEQFNLKDPTITMLTATNEAHSIDFFGRKDIHGGYFARTFIIAEHKRNRVNSLLSPLDNRPDYQELAVYLKEVAMLKGAFKPLASKELTEEYCIPVNGAFYTHAGARYERWYEELANSEIIDETGTMNRFGDSVLKVAMLLALAKEPKLEIDDDVMERAIDACQRLIGNMRQVTHGTRGLSDSHALKALIMKEMLSRPGNRISQGDLQRKMWMNYGEPGELMEIMNSLEGSGFCKHESHGNTVYYYMTAEEVMKYSHYFSGKNVSIDD